MRAGDGIRTHDNDVGNVVLYQLSYTRILLLHSHGIKPRVRPVSEADQGKGVHDYRFAWRPCKGSCQGHLRASDGRLALPF